VPQKRERLQKAACDVSSVAFVEWKTLIQHIAGQRMNKRPMDSRGDAQQAETEPKEQNTVLFSSRYSENVVNDQEAGEKDDQGADSNVEADVQQAE